jgi:hypothetical protein
MVAPERLISGWPHESRRSATARVCGTRADPRWINARHLSQVPDVFERVAVNKDQIRPLARLDGAGILVVAHCARGDDGRRLNRLKRRHPGLDVDLELTVQAALFCAICARI